MTASVLDRVEQRDDEIGPGAAGARIDAEVLGAQIVAGAAKVASTTAAWVEMVGVFDAANGAGQLWMDSTAQWLAFACSMSAGTAREHVRIARALREMPTVAEAFGRGVLSFSKVRECTRLVGQIDQDVLVAAARDFTATQLERAVRGFRAGRTERLEVELERRLTHRELSDGGVQITAVLAPEEAAIVLNALEVARARYRADAEEAAAAVAGELALEDDPNIVPRECYVWEVDGENRRKVPLKEFGEPRDTTSEIPSYTRADALIDVARGFLAAGRADASGEDRDLVVVHIDANDLEPADPTTGDVPAGTRRPSDADTGGDPAAAQPVASEGDPSVDLERAVRPRAGWIEQVGSVPASTAARILCTGRHQQIVTGSDGEVLHLGRTQRLVSRAQRRALMARDRTCRFPGCVRAIRLHAHHIEYWSLGGPTDIENLILLCHHHHVVVHAASITITKRRGAPGHAFTRIGGTPITAHTRNLYSRPCPIDDHRPAVDDDLLRELRTDTRVLDHAETGKAPTSEWDPQPPPPAGCALPDQMHDIRDRTSFYDHDHNVFPRWGGERLTEGAYWEILEPHATTPRTNQEARY